MSCVNDNWLHKNLYYWTISPRANSHYSSLAWYVTGSGYVEGNDSTHRDRYVMPSLYLKSNVSIASGAGTHNSPYKLSIN